MKNLFKLCVIILVIFIIPSCEKKPINQPVSVPYIRTIIKNITQTTVSFEGLVLSDGGDIIVTKGVCWSTTENPTAEQDNKIDIGPFDTFTGIVYNLNPNTKYYFRTFAQNSGGIGYGNTISRTTLLGEIGFNPRLEYGVITDIENNKYKTITIGTQTWMAENLRTTKYQNGDLIGTTSSPAVDITKESTPEYQWVYDGNESIAAQYGRLYTWYTINDSRNICPIGWHVPTHEEWTTLADFLINNGYGFGGSGNKIAKAMVATSGWDIDGTQGNPGNDQSNNNSSGFSAIPGGFRASDNAGFSFIGGGGYWWSSTDGGTILAWRGCYMWYSSGFVYMDASDKKVGLSVRCLRDN
jgi:uncharacterized protein (TIGR02145 family)